MPGDTAAALIPTCAQGDCICSEQLSTAYAFATAKALSISLPPVIRFISDLFFTLREVPLTTALDSSPRQEQESEHSGISLH